MRQRIFSEKPFARDEWGPAYPAVMLVLLSLLTALAGLRIGAALYRNPSLRGVLAFSLLFLWWYAYYRLHRSFAELPRRTVAQAIALMLIGLLTLQFALG